MRNRLRYAVPGLGLLVAAALGSVSGAQTRASSSLPSSSPGTTTFIYTTGPVRHKTDARFVNVYNPTASMVRVTAREVDTSGTDLTGSPFPLDVPAGATNGIGFGSAATFSVLTFESPTSEIHPSVSYVPANDATADHLVTLGDGDLKVLRQSCPLSGSCTTFSVDSAIFGSADGISSANTTLNAVQATANALNGKADALNGTANAINGKADALNTKLGGGVGPAGTGFNTNAFCAEGSVRDDAAGKLQMYVTLFSKTGQTVTINYITNKGTQSKSVPLSPGVRFTDDVNAFLTGPSGQFPGAPDVDTSVEVIGTAPFFLACPVYFDRQLGILGRVGGGTVQDGSHN